MWAFDDSLVDRVLKSRRVPVRPACVMADCIDLTDDVVVDVAVPSSARHADPDDAKARIMQFAASANRSNGMLQAVLPQIKPRAGKAKRGRGEPVGGPNPPPPASEQIILVSSSSDDDDGEEKEERMEDAAAMAQMQRPFKRMRLHGGGGGGGDSPASSKSRAAVGTWSASTEVPGAKPLLPQPEGAKASGEVSSSSGDNAMLAKLRLEREARQRQREQQEQEMRGGAAATSAAAATAPATSAAAATASKSTAAKPSSSSRPEAAAVTRMPPRSAGVAATSTVGALPGQSRSRDPAPASAVENADGAAGVAKEVSILSYNVWFKEEVALEERMQGLAGIIEECGFPDFILLQVTWAFWGCMGAGSTSGNDMFFRL